MNVGRTEDIRGIERRNVYSLKEDASEEDGTV
jgi:hypothetical protein